MPADERVRYAHPHFLPKGGENELKILTINQTAAEKGLPHTYLRALQAQGKLPGFYSGTRFYVNVDMLCEQLEAECRANAGGNKEAAQ